MVVEYGVCNHRDDEHGCGHNVLPLIDGWDHVAAAGAEQEKEDVVSVDGNLQSDGQVGLHLIMLVEVPLIHPVDDGDRRHEYKQEVGDLEGVVGIEGPNVE